MLRRRRAGHRRRVGRRPRRGAGAPRRRRWPRPSRRPRSVPAGVRCAPSSTSSCTAASASPGSTTPTSTCAAPSRSPRSSTRAGDAARDAVRLVRDGVARTPDLDLPPEAERYRADGPRVRRLAGWAVRGATAAPGSSRPATSCRTGRRRGGATRRRRRAARHRAGAARRSTSRATASAAGSSRRSPSTAPPEQSERWIRPDARGEITWCQLFSEPGAGSDAAGVRTKATTVDGGWKVTGQKVWTTGARTATGASPPSAPIPTTPKHDGHHRDGDRPARARRRHPSAARGHRRTPCSTRCSSTTCSCPTTDVVGPVERRLEGRARDARQRARVDRRGRRGRDRRQGPPPARRGGARPARRGAGGRRARRRRARRCG